MTTPQQPFGQPFQPFVPQQAPPVQFPAFTQPYQAPQAQPQGNFAQAQNAPAPPAAMRGTLAAGWDQGAGSKAYGSSAKWVNEGDVFTGIVARDMVDGDCRQSTDPGTKQPKFFPKSGQPQYEFMIPFNVAASAAYPDGKSTMYTSKYKLHQSVVRAMITEGYTENEGLHEGDLVQVQRIADVMVGMGRAHEFISKVTRAGTFDPAQLGIAIPQAAPVQAPAAPFVPQQGTMAQQAYVAAGAFLPEQAAPVPPTQVPAQAASPAQAPALGQPAAPFVPAQAAPQAVPTTPVAPAAAPTSIPQIPGLTPEQAALVAQYGAAPQG